MHAQLQQKAERAASGTAARRSLRCWLQQPGEASQLSYTGRGCMSWHAFEWEFVPVRLLLLGAIDGYPANLQWAHGM